MDLAFSPGAALLCRPSFLIGQVSLRGPLPPSSLRSQQRQRSGPRHSVSRASPRLSPTAFLSACDAAASPRLRLPPFVRRLPPRPNYSLFFFISRGRPWNDVPVPPRILDLREMLFRLPGGSSPTRTHWGFFSLDSAPPVTGPPQIWDRRPPRLGPFFSPHISPPRGGLVSLNFEAAPSRTGVPSF